MKNIWLTSAEGQAIDRACAALDGQRSGLMAEAVLEAAHGMGIYAGSRKGGTGAWWHVLERRERCSRRVSISLSARVADVLARAAGVARLSEPRFVVSATLAYCERLRREARAA